MTKQQKSKGDLAENSSGGWNTLKSILPIIRLAALLAISLSAFGIRIFSVLRYESIIHEFDPWFNYRMTMKIVHETGLLGFHDSFDNKAWYPIGRELGKTSYPGMMYTVAIIYHFLKFIGIPLDVRNICVFLAPCFAPLTALGTYLLTSEITGKMQAGLLAALFISVIPSYMSRSVAGSYDYEAIAITQMVWCFYLWNRAIKRKGILPGILCGLVQAYMACSWGGYTFVMNMIAIHCFALIVIGEFNDNLYLGYSSFYLSSLSLMVKVHFIGARGVLSSEYLAFHAIFFLCQGLMLLRQLENFLTKEQISSGLQKTIKFLLPALLLALFILQATGVSGWSPRSLTLLDPTYASKYIPIVASVSEHQASSWSSMFLDQYYLIIFAPIGLYYCFRKPDSSRIFLGLYLVLSTYFAAVMIRLLLVMAPAVCVASGIGISKILRTISKSIHQPEGRMSRLAGFGLMCLIGNLIIRYMVRSNLLAAGTYSSPSVILASSSPTQRVLFDDFREAYYWLRKNTDPDNARVLSWWDYGYQITGFSERTTIVDNNTWNTTQIGEVGRTMARPEPEAFEICELYDAE